MAYYIFNGTGLVGVLCILAAYYLLQADILNNGQLRFQLLNLIGALLIMISLLYSWNLSSFLMELAWASISVWGICKILKNRVLP